ncbi:hypothetical protein BH09SUM1_BH09SUM1_14060 [soil metagenome]
MPAHRIHSLHPVLIAIALAASAAPSQSCARGHSKAVQPPAPPAAEKANAAAPVVPIVEEATDRMAQKPNLVDQIVPLNIDRINPLDKKLKTAPFQAGVIHCLKREYYESLPRAPVEQSDALLPTAHDAVDFTTLAKGRGQTTIKDLDKTAELLSQPVSSVADWFLEASNLRRHGSKKSDAGSLIYFDQIESAIGSADAPTSTTLGVFRVAEYSPTLTIRSLSADHPVFALLWWPSRAELSCDNFLVADPFDTIGLVPVIVYGYNSQAEYYKIAALVNGRVLDAQICPRYYHEICREAFTIAAIPDPSAKAKENNP